MIDVGPLPGFIVVILLFLLPPGPDMAFMVAVGLEGGRRAALEAILDVGTGMSVYATAVVVGVAGVAQSYPLLLDAVKVFGAAYLLWRACGSIRNARPTTRGPVTPQEGGPISEVALYRTIGVLAGAFHSRFKDSRNAGVLLNYAAGAVYVVLAGVVLVEALTGLVSNESTAAVLGTA